MRAVGYFLAGSIHRPEALMDIEIPKPVPGEHDLLVRVHAVSVNPVDTKVRMRRNADHNQPVILGWDAVGIVEGIGAAVKGFSPGDRVYYAGALERPGSNAEFHLVDERLVAHAPENLNDAEAAALPLTTITAWEILFERLRVERGGGEGQTLLIVGGAGGVGSMLIQLARKLTNLRVVATASREESRDWCKTMGAHHVINHALPWSHQLQAIGINEVEFIASLTHTDQHWLSIVETAAPFGQIALIDDPTEPLDVLMLKRKSLSLHWELMFTRSLYATDDMAKQGALLQAVAKMVDAGELRTTLGRHMGTINADNLRDAHALIESGTMHGKAVLVGFDFSVGPV